MSLPSSSSLHCKCCAVAGERRAASILCRRCQNLLLLQFCQKNLGFGVSFPVPSAAPGLVFPAGSLTRYWAAVRVRGWECSHVTDPQRNTLSPKVLGDYPGMFPWLALLGALIDGCWALFLGVNNLGFNHWRLFFYKTTIFFGCFFFF